MKFHLSKRSFLNLFVKTPLLFFASYAGLGVRLLQAADIVDEVFTDTEQAALQRMCYLLFPYPDSDGGIYKRCVAGIATLIHEQPEKTAIIKSGIGKLNTMAAGVWDEAGEQQQILLLKGIEGEAFFQLVYHVVLDQVYTNKAVWDQIGYEGSSLEFGGYLNRGFNDIDWL